LPREIAALMPDFAAGILEALIADGAGPIFDGDYFIQLLSAIRRMPPGRLAAYGDVGEGLENRIARAARSYSGYESLIEAISTKRYPKTRIRRILARILLGFDNGALAGLDLDSGPPYIRALGFSPAGQALLAQAARQRGSAAPVASTMRTADSMCAESAAHVASPMSATLSAHAAAVTPAASVASAALSAPVAPAVPVVTKFAHLKRSADPRQRAFMELDARATDIYATAFAGNPRRMEAGQDYTRGAIRAH
ncbi:MAG: nucleotidyltransferase family protein, partial [Clostridiales bacterium]|nr:nucleotidyltransferase family protein [Clostridiales bacterium]